MPRRVPIRLVRLLAIACACLLPAAAAQAAAPPNDTRSAAQPVTSPTWTSLNSPQDVSVQATDWGDATTGPEDADPLPSCTGSVGFRSMWYSLSVPEASVLRVTVVSTDPVRYQPVVSILDPSNTEVGCGLANDVRLGATANATAYVTPIDEKTPATYLIRVAEVVNNSPSGGLPALTVRFAAQDVTPPHIRVVFPSGKVPPGLAVAYDASQTTDNASQVDAATARWEFDDRRPDGTESIHMKPGMQVRYAWLTPGIHQVILRVADRAGNESMYRFSTLVLDAVRPDVKFGLRPPEPGARRIRITVAASESVKVRLLVTQVGHKRPLLKRFVNFWGKQTHERSVPLRGIVGKGLLVISGIARDRSGNTTALPQCVVDPVSGQGSCTSL
jgi:PKD domain